MSDEQIEVSVSFDPGRSYFTVGSELRRRIEATLLPDEPSSSFGSTAARGWSGTGAVVVVALR